MSLIALCCCANYTLTEHKASSLVSVAVSRSGGLWVNIIIILVSLCCPIRLQCDINQHQDIHINKISRSETICSLQRQFDGGISMVQPSGECF